MAEDKKKQDQLLQLPTTDALRELYGFRPVDFVRVMSPEDLRSIPPPERDPEFEAAIEKVREQEFIREVKAGKVSSVERSIQLGINVNAQDKFGMTALHYAAATGFRPCIRLLVNSGQCNYLLQDNKGRLASELAYEWGRDYAVGLLLQKKEARQAYEEGRP
ncbi:ankyrin repeat domain-containing protein [Pseudomonas asiatica]|uniref:ankyrin repeat domain-containing protein n=1 Tax=Pseudomonas asiatica TaxID=2219225 RepID=UPI0010C121E9|nr:ankyrin repeat domain-containing protein [Pseudomonas asiatica]